MTEQTYDLAVVGAGLSALSALRAGVARGATVLADHGSSAGGFLSAALPAPGFDDAWELISAFTPPANVAVRTAATAVGLLPASAPGEAHTVLVRERGGTAHLRARCVLIACGGLEITRESAAIPGTRPAGVMTPVLVHQLLRRGYLPGRSALVYGNSRYAAATAGRLAVAGVETVLAPPMDGPVPPVYGAVRVEAPAEVVALGGFPRLCSVALRRGGVVRELAVDTLVYAAGMAANTHWLRGSGVGVTPGGAVVVDDACESNVPGVFAIGTAVAPDLDHGRSIAMGRAVAAVLAGRYG